jgi:hypothetical protein
VIDRPRLLRDLQVCARELERSLRERLQAEPALRAALEAEHKQATEAQRTGDAWVDWLDERLAQVAASWVLACVFVRFLEDNDLIEPPRLAGRGDRLQRARDQETIYFRKHPSHGHREYLEHVLREVSALPGLGPLLGEGKNPLWTLGPTADGARELLEGTAKRPEAIRQRDPATREMVHDYTDPAWDTRFLGDLYQDLSELARKRYALLQTPHFVESFILDRTLEPALAEFGLAKTNLIDPACGSGHFLLGAFSRLVARWQAAEPGTPAPALAQKALDQLAGVDVNPFAVAITRFRLLLAALQAAGVKKLRQAFGFAIHVTTGDSLLHGPRPGRIEGRQGYLLGEDPLAHVYARIEDPETLRRILGQRYAVVVANPPYITPKDPALNKAYRDRFESCHRQYSLAVPFKERCFDLVRWQDKGEPGPAGFVGLITANSFTKREFGKKLIEEFIPRWDLTHVLDTSGAYIPGHGTPTVILLARGRKPVASTVRAVRGIRGEPSTPDDPAQGQVWRSIVRQVDHSGTQDAFTSVDDVERDTFHNHPWSLGGGGAAELKERLEDGCGRRLSDLVMAIGRTTVLGEDDVWLSSSATARRKGVSNRVVPFVFGEVVRDWQIASEQVAVYPYVKLGGEPIPREEFVVRVALWPYRTPLARRTVFGKTFAEKGLPWWVHLEHYTDKLRTPLSIAFAFVAPHNHFALDRGGKVFNRSAPVIKLATDATEDDHLALLGLLNSSTACFWMKQVFYPKERASGDKSKEKCRAEANRYEFSGTGMLPFPVPADLSMAIVLARQLDRVAAGRSALEPSAVLTQVLAKAALSELRKRLDQAQAESERLYRRAVVLQEELDWACYKAFGLSESGHDPTIVDDEALGCAPEQRPAFSSEESDRELPTSMRKTYARRRALINASSDLALIETAVYKRLWLGQQGVFGHSTKTYADRTADALREWLLDRLEAPALWTPDDPKTRSCAQLADTLRGDRQFQQVATVYRGSPDYDLTELVMELVREEAVPLVSALRYTESGLAKRRGWEQIWQLQRLEDAIDVRAQLPSGDPARLTAEQVEAMKRREVGQIPVPPKYGAPDFQSQVFWRHRGPLDVPKERFLLVSLAEKEQDPTPVIGWAGWDHLQQAKALAALFLERKDRDGWTDKERLAPILLAVHELVPWLLQWHNAMDPAYGRGLGTYFQEFVEDEARELGLTVQALAALPPPARPRGRKKAAAAQPDDAQPPAQKRTRKPAGVTSPTDQTPAPKRGRKKKPEQVAPDANDS